jgi:hypothetical protein
MFEPPTSGEEAIGVAILIEREEDSPDNGVEDGMGI